MTTTAPSPTRSDQVVNSSLWAAWADALGFISELTDESGLRRRLEGIPLSEPVAWRRRAGGPRGVLVELPAGCYSDDTQLRLAVGRAINGTGFDVEAFSTVELTVWPSYALGGGRASKAAASNMTRPGTAWFSNFFDGWTNAGGNGVAMRIQPHVWAAAEPASVGPHLLDVLIDGVTTHGHPRALFGAVLHAVALGATIDTGAVPDPAAWGDLLENTSGALALLEQSQQLAGLWRPSWEAATGELFADAWRHTLKECADQLEIAASCWAYGNADRGANDEEAQRILQLGYGSLLERLELRRPEVRGSGTHTVVAALALAAAGAGRPLAVARAAAGALGTDTDTIATMAAALVGAATGVPAPPSPVLDAEYFESEGRRFAAIAAGQPSDTFSYPDLLEWAPPRTQLDPCGLVDGQPALAGLGWCEPIKGLSPGAIKDTRWQWMRTDFGPSMLIKQRNPLRDLAHGNWPVRRGLVHRVEPEPPRVLHQNPKDEGDTAGMASPAATELDRVARPDSADAREQRDRARLRNEAVHGRASDGSAGPLDVDELLQWVRRQQGGERDMHRAVGYVMERLADRGTVEQTIAFTMGVRQIMRTRGRPGRDERRPFPNS